MEKPSTTPHKLASGFIGAITAAVTLFPATMVIAYGIGYLLFGALGMASSSNTDDFMVVFLCVIPAAVLGLIGGSISASLPAKKPGWTPIIFKSILSGMISAIVVSSFLTGSIFNGWIAAGREERRMEMRPNSYRPIPLLGGTYEEMTTIAGAVNLFDITTDGHLLAYSMDNQIILWDMSDNTQLGEPLTGHSQMISDLTFSPDSHWLVSGGYDQKVVVWSILTHEERYVLLGHQAPHIRVAVSPDNSVAASGDNKGGIFIWDLNSGREMAQFKIQSGDSLYCLDFSPDGKYLLVSRGGIGASDELELWNIEKREPTGKLEVPYWTNGFVQDIDFSPDGKVVAGAALFGPILWNLEDQTTLGAVQETDTGAGIDFSPDGRQIVTTDSHEIYLWDVSSREPIGKLVNKTNYVRGAKFLPDGRILALYVENTTSSSSLTKPCDDDCCTETTSRIGIWSFANP
jgi:WD40 repeat protein